MVKGNQYKQTADNSRKNSNAYDGKATNPKKEISRTQSMNPVVEPLIGKPDGGEIKTLYWVNSGAAINKDLESLKRAKEVSNQQNSTGEVVLRL